MFEIPEPRTCFCCSDDDDHNGILQKIAIMAYPSYEAHPGSSDSDVGMHTYLTRMKLLPGTSIVLDSSGQISRLTRGFRAAGVSCPMALVGYMTAKEFKRILASQAANQPAVLVVVYCGHGTVKTYHGIVYFSGGTRLDSRDIAECLSGFKGTLIQLFNMWSVGDDLPVSSNVYPESLQNPSELSYKCINIFSSPGRTSHVASHTNSVIDVFVALGGTTYIQLVEKLGMLWSTQHRTSPIPFIHFQVSI